jgi:mono/diheme cytochrome c family protein
MRKAVFAIVGGLGAVILASHMAEAQRSFAEPRMFQQQGGEAIFRGICQDCHMADARGASGAGSYPALARNPKLEVAGYPISVVLNGQKAMPEFGSMLSDQQIADVVNYVRSHFGNNFKDQVSAQDVKAAR